jgi:hypothetical protein
MTPSHKEEFLNILNHAIKMADELENLHREYTRGNEQRENVFNYMKEMTIDLLGNVQLSDIQDFLKVVQNFIELNDQLDVKGSKLKEVQEQNRIIFDYIQEGMSLHCIHS